MDVEGTGIGAGADTGGGEVGRCPNAESLWAGKWL
jgi:hypothetical protein